MFVFVMNLEEEYSMYLREELIVRNGNSLEIVKFTVELRLPPPVTQRNANK